MDKYQEGNDLTNKIIFCANKDTGFIKESKIFEYYDEVIQKSNNMEMIDDAINGVMELGSIFGMKNEAILIMRKGVKRESVMVRFMVAEKFFGIGNKKEAYLIYINIITMNKEDLERNLENRELPNTFTMEIKSEKAQKDTAYKKDLNERIANWRTAPILNILQRLLGYDDSKTKELLRKVIKENYYISSVVSAYKQREISQDLANEKRSKFISKLEKVLSDK